MKPLKNYSVQSKSDANILFAPIGIQNIQAKPWSEAAVQYFTEFASRGLIDAEVLERNSTLALLNLYLNGQSLAELMVNESHAQYYFGCKPPEKQSPVPTGGVTSPGRKNPTAARSPQVGGSPAPPEHVISPGRKDPMAARSPRVGGSPAPPEHVISPGRKDPMAARSPRVGGSPAPPEHVISPGRKDPMAARSPRVGVSPAPPEHVISPGRKDPTAARSPRVGGSPAPPEHVISPGRKDPMAARSPRVGGSPAPPERVISPGRKDPMAARSPRVGGSPAPPEHVISPGRKDPTAARSPRVGGSPAPPEHVISPGRKDPTVARSPRVGGSPAPAGGALVSPGKGQSHVVQTPLSTTANVVMVSSLERDELPSDTTPAIVMVTVAPSPTSFYIQNVGLHAVRIKELTDRLNSQLQNYTSSYRPQAKGELIYAQFSQDGAWYRAEVLDIKSDSDIHIMFVDHGNEDRVGVAQIAAVDPTEEQPPLFAVHCSLAEVAGMSEGSDWKPDLLQPYSKVFNASLKKKIHGKHAVVLSDPETELCINSSLLQSGMLCKGSEIILVGDLPPLTYISGKRVDGTVTDGPSPTSLTVQVLTLEYLPHHSVLQSELANMAGKGYAPTTVGQMVCSKFSQDQTWYRAEVLELRPAGKVYVKFVDYGNKEEVGVESIAEFTESLLSVPVQGVLCSMAGITGVAPGQPWDAALLNPFQKIEMMIHSGDGTPVVELFEPGDSVSINERLVKQGVLLGEQPVIPMLGLKDVPKLDFPVGTKTNIVVWHVVSPKEFYATFIQEETQEHQLALTGLGEAVQDGPGFNPQEGELVCGQYMMEWSRAECLTVQPGGTAKVMFIDFGNTETLTESELRQMPPEFVSIPQQVQCCSLVGGKGTNNGAWTEQATSELWNMVQGKQLPATVKGKCNGIADLEVELEEGSLASLLTDRGFAVKSRSPTPEPPTMLATEPHRTKASPRQCAASPVTVPLTTPVFTEADLPQQVVPSEFEAALAFSVSPSEFYCQVAQGKLRWPATRQA